MKTTSQIAELTGISTRTLQYYDEIGLLKPSKLTPSGYRLYNDEALERLQQILFFKELDFKLKEIQEILQKPDFDKIAAFKKQKKLLCLKRDRLNKLIQLLGKLERGEECMSFKEFDLSEYIEALEQFKKEKIEEVIQYWGSVENFDQIIQHAREDETQIAKLAIKEFGSIEKYTEVVKNNLEHLPEKIERIHKMAENKDEIVQKNDDLFLQLVKDIAKDPTSEEIQATVQEIIEFTQKTSTASGMDLGEGYWNMMLELYSQATYQEIVDKKYGKGASDYIARAFQYYLQK